MQRIHRKSVTIKTFEFIGYHPYEPPRDEARLHAYLLHYDDDVSVNHGNHVENGAMTTTSSSIAAGNRPAPVFWPQGASSMQFTVRPTPDAVEVMLSGRFEFTDHERFRDVAALVAANPGKRFVLDVGGLDFIDSAGLGMILILQEEAERGGVGLTVRRARGDVRRSIELARIDEIVKIEFE